MILNLKDKASTRTNGWLDKWDTARLQLAGRLKTRVMGVFWEEVDELKEGMWKKWCLPQPGPAGSHPHRASQRCAGVCVCWLWHLGGHPALPGWWLSCVPRHEPVPHSG